MKRYAALLLGIFSILPTSGCTAGNSTPAESVTDSCQSITGHTDHAESFSSTSTSETTSANSTTPTPVAPQYQNNSAGGGYVAETEQYRFFIDRETLCRVNRESEAATVLLSMAGIGQLNIVDADTLYCTSPKGIYRLDAETGDAALVYPLTLISGPWVSLIIAEETAYFSDGVTLRSCGLDFQDPTTIYNAANLYIDQLLYANNTLYFSAYRPNSGSAETDEQSGVFACLPNGVVQVYHGYCAGIADNGDGLCISVPQQQALLHLSYDPADSSATVLCEGQFGAVCATPYGIAANDSAMNVVLVEGSTQTALTLGAGYCLNAAEDALYYLRLSDGALCCIPFSEMQGGAAP